MEHAPALDSELSRMEAERGGKQGLRPSEAYEQAPLPGYRNRRHMDALLTLPVRHLCLAMRKEKMSRKRRKPPPNYFSGRCARDPESGSRHFRSGETGLEEVGRLEATFAPISATLYVMCVRLNPNISRRDTKNLAFVCEKWDAERTSD